MSEKKRLSEFKIKEMFLSMFFWVVENRPSWLQEAINRKKESLKKLGIAG